MPDPIDPEMESSADTTQEKSAECRVNGTCCLSCYADLGTCCTHSERP